jgi:hypothetical protein
LPVPSCQFTACVRDSGMAEGRSFAGHGWKPCPPDYFLFPATVFPL